MYITTYCTSIICKQHTVLEEASGLQIYIILTKLKHQSVQEYNIGKMNIPGLSGRINRVKLILRIIQVEISECDLHVAILKEYLDINRLFL